MSDTRRKSHHRLCAIALKLRRNEPFDATFVAEFGLRNRKTMARDIDFFRSLGWVIVWDGRERTYVLKSAPKPTRF